MIGMIEREYDVTDEQFREGTTEMIEITMDKLNALKKEYIKTKDPDVQKMIIKYEELLFDLKLLVKSYNIYVNSKIGVQPIIVFSDGGAIFGHKGKREMEFSIKWFNIITKQHNGKEMVT